jgi:uncharacterized protein (DUF2336 family)
MIMLLDDPSPIVRLALSEALASSELAPPAIIHALSCDQHEIASPVLQRSPLLLDADLVDLVATGGPVVQATIAHRVFLPRSIAAAIAEIGSAEACLILLENRDADIAPISVERIVQRFGHLAVIRETLLQFEGLPAAIRQALVIKLSETLAGFVVAREWLAEDRAQRITKDACEKATVTLAADTPYHDVRPLIRHLRETGQLTAGLILRALLSGNLTMFEEALADLSGLPLSRVEGLIHDKGNAGFRALYEKAGLPATTFPAFREAVAAMHEDYVTIEPGGNARLRRRMIERVLTRCETMEQGDIEPLLTLLRRFATEAAREEARMFCDELVYGIALSYDDRLVA